MKFPSISKSLSLVGSCGNKKNSWRKTYCWYVSIGYRAKSGAGLHTSTDSLLLGYSKRSSYFSRSRRATPGIPFHPDTQRESLRVPHALGTRLRFLAPAVAADCRLQAAQRQRSHLCSQAIRKGLQGLMGCAEKASGRTKWDLETSPGHAKHFTSVIQVRQGCQSLLLPWLCQHRGNEPGLLAAWAQWSIPSWGLGLINSKVFVALSERPANPFILGMGLLQGNCVPGVSP